MQFTDSGDEQQTADDTIIINNVGFNTQSLMAHKEDVETHGDARRRLPLTERDLDG